MDLVHPLDALSPLDGRYRGSLVDVARYFSEFALMKTRTEIEVRWFTFLRSELNLPIDSDIVKTLEKAVDSFSLADCESIKETEKTTNHDVKPVEYFLKDKIDTPYREYLHFGITSEDVNNTAYALMHARFRTEILVPLLEETTEEFMKHARAGKEMVMPGRTHGQIATPTTVGKEFAYFARRFFKIAEELGKSPIAGKMGGAVGNHAALVAAMPEIDWYSLSEKFVKSLGLEYTTITKQIEPHDWNAALYHASARLCSIVVDACKDIWLYASTGYIRQSVRAGEVGSSTMPHKVNPIDFENAWGNSQLAQAIFSFLADKLTVTFYQRDLSDSTVMRNAGSAFGYLILAVRSLLKGLGKISFDEKRMSADVAAHPEVMAEAIQTVMRRFNLPGGYELMKAMTRGKRAGREELDDAIRALDIPQNEKDRLLNLTPEKYIGISSDLVDRIDDEIRRRNV